MVGVNKQAKVHLLHMGDRSVIRNQFIHIPIDTCLDTAPSCLANETAASIHTGKQKRLHHLKCNGVHLNSTAWSKQEHQCAGTMLFKNKICEGPWHTNKKSKQGVCFIETKNSPDTLFTEIYSCL
jgi:hypothetical protein